MLASELKEYIIENNKTLELITLLGCTSIKEYKDKFQCARPKGDNPTGMVIWKDNLRVKIYTPHEGSGDIFTLTMATYDCDFIESLKIIHELLGLHFSKNDKPTVDKSKEDPLAKFKKITRKRNRYSNDLDDEVLYTANQLMCSFVNIPHISWVKEGILPSIIREYNIGYDFRLNRITIPWRNINPYEEKFVGCVGRTTIPNYELFKIPKYWSYNHFKKSNYLYSFAENYSYILKEGYVVVVEAEKSVLKAASRLIRTFVAAGGHTISQQQRKLLVSLGVEIVISWDSDISLYDVLETCELFYGIRKVSFTYDVMGFLGEKESIGDLPRDDMKYLIDTRQEYNEEWRQKYLQMKEERSKK